MLVERPIVTERTELAGVPVLHVRARALQGPAPTIIYFHGWSSKKEANVVPAELLAIDGFRVILPDQIHHGERGALTDYPGSAKTHFWRVILNSVGEADVLAQAAVATGWSDPDRIGVAGTSMGGFVTAGVLARYPWAKAAVLNMGCPCYCWVEEYYRQSSGAFPADPAIMDRLQPYDPELHIGRIAPRPILMQHGVADKSVPVGGVQRFYALAAPYYEGQPERLALTVADRLDHYVTKDMLGAMRDWFVRWLSSTGTAN